MEITVLEKLSGIVLKMSSLSQSRYFSIKKAQNILGYKPIIPMQNAIKITMENDGYKRPHI